MEPLKKHNRRSLKDVSRRFGHVPAKRSLRFVIAQSNHPNPSRSTLLRLAMNATCLTRRHYAWRRHKVRNTYTKHDVAPNIENRGRGFFFHTLPYHRI